MKPADAKRRMARVRKPVFVTACNLAYYLQTKILLRSLLRRGAIAQSRIAVMTFGDKHEALALGEAFESEFPRVCTIPVDVHSRGFAFVRSVVEARDWAFWTDYLRAWFGTISSNYIWVDSDIIARKNLAELSALSQEVDSIAMAQDFVTPAYDPNECNWMVIEMYEAMVRHVLGVRAHLFRDHRGYPLKFNCGVLVCRQNFATRWRRVYVGLQPLFASRGFARRVDRFRTRFGIPPPLGQGIWNVLHVQSGGDWLHPAFNGTASAATALLEHYCALRRAQHFPHAVRSRLY